MAKAIIDRATARAQGLKRYYSGEPCKYGHVAERQVINTGCMECGRIKSRAQHKLRDRDAERERLRAWKCANREKVNAKSRAANATPERIAYKAAWYLKNIERIEAKRRAEPNKYRAANIASAKAWAEANPEKHAEYMRIHARKRRAQKHKANGTHTAADLAEILKAQGNRCAYCKANLTKIKKNVDHIVPLARGGSNGRANLQYLCRPCNQAKAAKHPDDFARERGLIL